MIGAFILSACTSMTGDTDFCDNWSTDDGSGASVRWEPNENYRQIILEKIGSDRTYICAEINPSGRITVVNSDRDRKQHFAHNYFEKDGKLVFVTEELFVSTH